MRLRSPRATIRARLTGAATVAMMVMLAVACVAIVTIQRRALTSGVNEALRQRADNLTPIDPGTPALPGEGDREDSFAQILDGSGRVVAATDNVPGPAATPVTAADLRAPRFATVRLGQPSGRFRVLVRPIEVGSEPRILVLGKNLDDVDESVRVLAYSLAAVSPILTLLLGLLAWWLTGRTLRPVESMRREVQSIQGRELHRRVPVPDTDDEIAELARTMNGMLGRVEAASAQQQQFVDDASHELRTPLTRMVTDLEVAIAHPGQEPSDATLRRVLADATDLRDLLHDLLYLARTSHDRATAQDEVDLDDIALRAAQELRAASTVEVDTTGVGAARVLGDARELERAIRNVLDNAARHARRAVAISTSTAEGRCVVDIDDDGAGVPAADRAKIFERFTRLDEARARPDGGAGLGLAIVQDIASRHHGHITVTDAPLGGARFRLTLPAAD